MGNHTLLKQINKLLVLKTILDNKTISRAKISRLVDLNKATVSNLTDELIKEGFVIEKGYGHSKGGRRPVLLEINKNVGLITGIDLGVNYIHLVLTNFVGEIVWEKNVNIRLGESQERILQVLFKIIEEALNIAPETQKGILGIGIGVPGIVEKNSGTVLIAPNLRWKDVPLKAMVEERFNLPVYIDNEANAGALGEKWFGGWGDVSHLVYVSVGIGIGAGIVIGDEIYRGAKGFAGEIGHTTIDFNDDVCSCGNVGCLENFTSERALLSVIQKMVESGWEDEYINRKSVDKLDASYIIDSAKLGSKVALHAIKNIVNKLGIGIANLVNIFNPDIVIIGNKASFMGDLFLEELRRVVYKRSFVTRYHNVRVEVSRLKDRACVLGCVAMVISDMLAFPDYV